MLKLIVVSGVEPKEVTCQMVQVQIMNHQQVSVLCRDDKLAAIACDTSSHEAVDV